VSDSSSAISMTATTGSDPSGVQYSFDETSGNPGGSDSGWQSSSSYTDSGLDADTQYTYRVQMCDQSANQNTGSWSTSESATTDPVSDWTQIIYDDFEGGFGNWIVGHHIGAEQKALELAGFEVNPYTTFTPTGPAMGLSLVKRF